MDRPLRVEIMVATRQTKDNVNFLTFDDPPPAVLECRAAGCLAVRDEMEELEKRLAEPVFPFPSR